MIKSTRRKRQNQKDDDAQMNQEEDKCNVMATYDIDICPLDESSIATNIIILFFGQKKFKTSFCQKRKILFSRQKRKTLFSHQKFQNHISTKNAKSQFPAKNLKLGMGIRVPTGFRVLSNRVLVFRVYKNQRH